MQPPQGDGHKPIKCRVQSIRQSAKGWSAMSTNFIVSDKQIRLLKSQAKLLEAMDTLGQQKLGKDNLVFTAIYYACELLSKELAETGYREANPFYTGGNRYQCTITK
jgi:hypothetical protein